MDPSKAISNITGSIDLLTYRREIEIFMAHSQILGQLKFENETVLPHGGEKFSLDLSKKESESFIAENISAF